MPNRPKDFSVTASVPANDDYLILDGATNGTRKLLGSFIGQSAVTRQVSRVLYSDGTTSNRRGEATFGTAGAVAAMPVSIPFEFDVPTSNPSALIYSFAFAGSGTSGPDNQNNALSLYINTSGDLVVRQCGVNGLTDSRRLTFGGFRAANSGLRVRGIVVFESADSTTNPKIYANGIDITSSFTLTTAGTVPNWVPTTLDTTKFLSGYTWPAGRFVPHAPILGALTAAEVLAWTQTGRLPTWCEVAAGSTATRYASDFSAGVDSWSANLVTVAGNIDGIGGQDNCLRATLSGGSSSLHQVSRTLTTAIGRGYLYSVDVYIPSTNANPFGVELRANGGATTLAFTTTKDAWVTLSGSFVENGDLQIRVRVTGTINSDGDLFYVRNVKVYDLGPLAKWEIQPGQTVAKDYGSNGIPLTLTSGITAIGEPKEVVDNGSGGKTLAASGTNQNITLTPSGTGIVTTAARLTTTNSTASTSTTTGALVVSGGVGVADALYVGSIVAPLGLSVNRDREAQIILNRTITTTGANWMQITNGGGTSYFGLDSSAGNRLFAVGGEPYAAGVVQSANYPLLFGTNNTMRLKIAAGGDVSLTSTTEATTAGAGSLTTAGGIYAAKKVVTSGDVEVADIGEGVIIKSPNGTRWRITVSDAGAFVATSL